MSENEESDYQTALNSCVSMLSEISKHIDNLTFHVSSQHLHTVLSHIYIEDVIIPKLRKFDLKYRDWCKEYHEDDKGIREHLQEGFDESDQELLDWLNKENVNG